MANQTIQNYLNDITVPISKRRSIKDALTAGTDEATVIAAITSKYGDKYGVSDITAGISQVQMPETMKPAGTVEDNRTGLEKTVEFGGNFLHNLNPVKYVQESMAPAAQLASNIVTEGTIKPIVKGALTASAGAVLSPVQNVIPGGKRGDEPMELPWVGNINPNANTPGQNVGLAADVWLSYLNIVAPIRQTVASKGIIRQGMRAGGQAMAKELEYDADTTTGEVLTAGAIGGTVGMAAQAFSNFISGKLSTSKMVKVAKEAGLKKEDIAYIKVKVKTPRQKATMKKFLDAAALKIKEGNKYDPKVPMPTEIAADNITIAARELADKMDEMGAGIGDIKSAIYKDVLPEETVIRRTDQITTNYVDDLVNKHNVLMGDKGKLDFTQSDFKNSPGDQKLLQEVYDDLWGISNLKEAYINKNSIAKSIYTGKAQQTLTTSKGIAENVRQQLDELLPQDLKELNKVFSTLKPLLGDIESKYGGGSQYLKGEAYKSGQKISGTNIWNFARRALSTNNKEHLELLLALQEQAKKHGIKGAGTLYDDVVMAHIAENIHNVEALTKPTGTKAILQGAMNLWKGQPVQAAKQLGQVVSNSQTASEAAEALLKDPKISAEIIRKIFSLPLMQQLGSHIKSSTPQSVTQEFMQMFSD